MVDEGSIEPRSAVRIFLLFSHWVQPLGWTREASDHSSIFRGQQYETHPGTVLFFLWTIFRNFVWIFGKRLDDARLPVRRNLVWIGRWLQNTDRFFFLVWTSMELCLFGTAAGLRASNVDTPPFCFLVPSLEHAKQQEGVLQSTQSSSLFFRLERTSNFVRGREVSLSSAHEQSLSRLHSLARLRESNNNNHTSITFAVFFSLCFFFGKRRMRTFRRFFCHPEITFTVFSDRFFVSASFFPSTLGGTKEQVQYETPNLCRNEVPDMGERGSRVLLLFLFFLSRAGGLATRRGSRCGLGLQMPSALIQHEVTTQQQSIDSPRASESCRVGSSRTATRCPLPAPLSDCDDRKGGWVVLSSSFFFSEEERGHMHQLRAHPNAGTSLLFFLLFPRMALLFFLAEPL